MSYHIPERQDEKAGRHADAAPIPRNTERLSPSLPEIPAPDLDLSLDFDLDSIIGSADKTANPEVAKVQKRASNVLKLAQENEKLKAELKAMSDRLEAAERRREELARKANE